MLHCKYVHSYTDNSPLPLESQPRPRPKPRPPGRPEDQPTC